MANQDERGRGVRQQVILIVEDEVLVRLDAAENLREAGYYVHEAADAVLAVELFQSKRPVDLLFTDINLGAGMSGLDLGLWALSNLPHLRVLVTTGETLKSAIPSTLGTVLAKPYSAEGLLARVKGALAAA